MEEARVEAKGSERAVARARAVEREAPLVEAWEEVRGEATGSASHGGPRCSVYSRRARATCREASRPVSTCPLEGASPLWLGKSFARAGRPRRSCTWSWRPSLAYRCGDADPSPGRPHSGSRWGSCLASSAQRGCSSPASPSIASARRIGRSARREAWGLVAWWRRAGAPTSAPTAALACERAAR